MAKLQTEALAKNLGLTRSTRFINVLELGIRHNSSNEEPIQRGYEISFELPLFDWGESRVVQAESRYRQALKHARETAVNAAIEAQRDFWLADADLAMALVGKPDMQPVSSASPAMAESGGGH